MSHRGKIRNVRTFTMGLRISKLVSGDQSTFCSSKDKLTSHVKTASKTGAQRPYHRNATMGQPTESGREGAPLMT